MTVSTSGTPRHAVAAVLQRADAHSRPEDVDEHLTDPSQARPGDERAAPSRRSLTSDAT
jgi:hypothetical protein